MSVKCPNCNATNPRTIVKCPKCGVVFCSLCCRDYAYGVGRFQCPKCGEWTEWVLKQLW